LMLRRVLELLLPTVLITEVTTAIETITEARGDVAEAEAGVMTVEIEVVSLRGNTGIDERPEDRLHFVMTKFEIDGDMNRTEIGGDYHLKEEVGRRITPLAILETHRQALI
jgi:hypothetical protein